MIFHQNHSVLLQGNECQEEEFLNLIKKEGKEGNGISIIKGKYLSVYTLFVYPMLLLEQSVVDSYVI